MSKQCPPRKAASPSKRCQCWIYKDGRRGRVYLYLAEEDGFDAAPKTLIENMGKIQFVMSIELHENRKLARADVMEVMRSLEQKGYYVQLPPMEAQGGHRLQ